MQLLKRKIDPFPMIKISSLSLENIDQAKWAEKVNEYVNEKYPRLSEGFRSVKFSEIDQENGNAVGTMAWRYGDNSISIPIIVDDFKMKEPDLAIRAGKIIPTDYDYIRQNLMEMDDGVIHNEEIDHSQQMDYISSIFEVNDVDDKGHPSGMKIGSATRTAILSALEEIPGQTIISSDQIEKLKTATCIDEMEFVTDYIVTEDEDNPYHYSGMAMRKKANGEMRVDQLNSIPEYKLTQIHNECELNKVAETLWLTPEVIKKDIKPIKRITSSGKYQVIINEKPCLGRAITPLISITGEGNKSVLFIAYKSNTKDSDDTFGESTRSINEPACSNGYNIEGEPTSWQYGDIYGVNLSKDDIKGEEVRIELEEASITQGLVGKNVVFISYPNNISIPYVVDDFEKINLGKDNEAVEVLDISMSDKTGKGIRVWLNQPVTKPIKADKAKMNSGEYSIISNTDRDVWLLPANYRVFCLPNERIDVEKPSEYIGNVMEQKIAEYSETISVSKIAEDEYEVSTSGIKLDRLTKSAANLYVRNYMGREVGDIDDLQYDTDYNIKKTAEVEIGTPGKEYSIIDKYRGEWFKVAQVVKNDKSIKEAIDRFNNSPNHNFKFADVSDIVKNISQVEFIDDNNSKGVKDILPLLNDSIDRIGQLLLLTRLSRIELNGNIVDRAFKALTTLYNEIKGENRDNE